MNSLIAIERIKQRIQKSDAQKNANFNLYEFEDAIEKAVNDLVRRTLHGMNQFLEGQEETTMRVDDLQVLLKSIPISVSGGNLYVEAKLPKDYRYYNRVTPYVSHGTCSKVRIKSYFVEEGNVDDYLRDANFKPDFKFQETFHTLIANKIRVYHDKQFTVDEIVFTYYKNPEKIRCDKAGLDLKWEWKEDFAELIIDEAAKILAGDTENTIAYQTAMTRIENNN